MAVSTARPNWDNITILNKETPRDSASTVSARHAPELVFDVLFTAVHCIVCACVKERRHGPLPKPERGQQLFLLQRGGLANRSRGYPRFCLQKSVPGWTRQDYFRIGRLASSDECQARHPKEGCPVNFCLPRTGGHRPSSRRHKRSLAITCNGRQGIRVLQIPNVDLNLAEAVDNFPVNPRNTP